MQNLLNLLIHTIWTYTITTLRAIQWKIPAKEFILDVDSGCKDRAHIQNNLYIFLFTGFAFWKTS